MKPCAPSASSRTDCSTLCAIIGRNTFSSKLPLAPPKFTATSLPNTWQHSIVTASDCVGLTLPGMIELPGSFSGIDSSPSPQRGPLASQRMSFAIFIRLAATVFSAPCANTSASAAAITSNLFGALTNGRPVSRPISAATPAANFGCAFRPVPTAVPPCASSYR
ncbi:hypothetical protein DM56_2278 [Burkholderia mallei]|nr:hypothetical protein DM56_2278 [Burkholderia mallei]